MARLLIRFVARLVGTTLATTFLVFAAVERSIDGGFRTVVFPAGFDPSDPRDQALAEALHLDRGLIVRYGHWLADALGGDLGRSPRANGDVLGFVSHRLTISLELAVVSMLVAVTLGVGLGLTSALRAGRPGGGAIDAGLGLAQSIPTFMSATLLISIFAVRLRWFPAAGWTRVSDSVGGNLRAIVLPVAALALAEIGIIARIIRADLQRVFAEDFIVSAVARGYGPARIAFRHALRPASLGLLTIVGLNLGSIISGAFVVEIVFGIGGLGPALIEASLNRDLHLLLGLTLYVVLVYVVAATVVDAVTFWADPRIRRP